MDPTLVPEVAGPEPNKLLPDPKMLVELLLEVAGAKTLGVEANEDAGFGELNNEANGFFGAVESPLP